MGNAGDGESAKTDRRILELEAELTTLHAELAEHRRKPAVGLVWENKPEAVQTQMEREVPVLRAMPSRRVGEDDARPHLLIEGDNLHALSCLQYTHSGRVDVIYIDPPYNTRTREGDRFRYDDDYVDPDDNWRHSKWLSFMDRRIRLAKELLAPGGFLAISIDDNEMAHLKLLLDQHFGEGNVKTIVVKMSEASGVKMASVKHVGTIAKLKEYVLFAQPGGIQGLRLETVVKNEIGRHYAWIVDGLSEAERSELRSILEQEDVSAGELARGDKLLRAATLTSAAQMARSEGIATDEVVAWRFKNSWRLIRLASSSAIQALAEAKAHTMKQQMFLVRSATGIPYMVRGDFSRTAEKPDVQILFADDNLAQHPGDFWSDITTTGIQAEGGISFKNGKKPLALLRRIIGAHQKKDALVLDFFAGSGSTAHAVAELNARDGGTRQCILVTNNEGDICTSVTLPRMKGVLTGSLPNGRTVPALPGSLRYYRCEFVPITRNRDAMLRRLASRAADLVAIREEAHGRLAGEESRYAVLSDGERRVVVWCDWAEDGLADVLESYAGEAENVLYMFGLGEGVDPEVVATHPTWRVEALPEPLRVALERAHARSRAR